MISDADDYPIHQSPEPIAFAGSDRNFYDRYFFNGFEVDGSLFFAIGIGIYPQLNIIDINFSVQINGRQYSLHASRVLSSERLDISIGPMKLEIVRPLHQIRFKVEEHSGLSVDLLFTGRAVPIQEPRFTRRISSRLFQDYTRMTQNGSWSGWVKIDDERVELRSAVGTRDRSWGIRPIGNPDSQPIVPASTNGFFWQWTPLNFSNFSIFFHVAADFDGTPWNTDAVLVPDVDGSEVMHCDRPRMDTKLLEGTRWPSHGELFLQFGQETMRLEFEPFLRFFMKGIGYCHPEWYHGRYHGPVKIAFEVFEADDQDPALLQNLHVQNLSRVRLTRRDGSFEETIGIFEQFALGRYEPLGLVDETDISNWSGE